MKLKPSAILFDMDGVLVDSLDSWWASLNEALVTHGEKKITRDEFIARYWGHDLRYNLERYGLDIRILRFCNTAYANHVDKIRVYPDTRPVLKKLNCYKKGVITNTPRDCTTQIIKILGIKSFFDVIMTNDDVNRGKPDPEIVLKACDYLKVSPENVILVGDTSSDVLAGHAAGCKVFGLNVKADVTIKRLSDLTNYVVI